MKKARHASPNPRLKALRLSRNWTQTQVADKIETTSLNISRWERGVSLPSLYFRERLCELFHVSVLDLGVQLEEKSEKQEVHHFLMQPDYSLPSSPRFWYIPYPRNIYFTGYKDILQFIHDTLRHDNTVARIRSCSLNGMGGIGKTQAALEYVYQYASHYKAVLWVHAETLETFLFSIVAIATTLNLPEKQEQDQGLLTEAVLHWLNKYRNWLLVIDNVNDIEIVKCFFSSAHHGSLLLTTRRQSLGSLTHNLILNNMSREEGARFLFQRARGLHNDTPLSAEPADFRNASTIVEAMDGLPLALDQAGAYINENKCSFPAYIALLQEHFVYLLNERDAYSDHPLSVMRTFMLAFEKIKQVNVQAAELLIVCSFLSPDAIPVAMLLNGAALLGPILHPLATHPLLFHNALKDLLMYSLLYCNAQTQVITIHRLTQIVLQTTLDEDRLRERIGYVATMLTDAFSDERFDVRMWQQREHFLPHALHCLKLSERWEDLYLQHLSLVCNVAFYLSDRARYTEAETLYRRALTMQKKCFGPEHPDSALVLNGLAYLLFLQRHYVEAENVYNQALAIQRQYYGEVYENNACTLNGLGYLYCAQGRYDEAKQLFREALLIWEQLPDVLSLNTAETFNCLASMAWLQQKYSEAELFLCRAMILREQILGVDHPDIAFNLCILAQLCTAQGKIDEVELIMQRVFAFRDRIMDLQQNEPDTMFLDLILFYRRRTEHVQADPFLQHVLHLWDHLFTLEKSHGPGTGNILNLDEKHIAPQGERNLTPVPATLKSERVFPARYREKSYSMIRDD